MRNRFLPGAILLEQHPLEQCPGLSLHALGELAPVGQRLVAHPHRMEALHQRQHALVVEHGLGRAARTPSAVSSSPASALASSDSSGVVPHRRYDSRVATSQSFSANMPGCSGTGVPSSTRYRNSTSSSIARRMVSTAVEKSPLCTAWSCASMYWATSSSVSGRRSALRPKRSMNSRRHWASPGPLGVQPITSASLAGSFSKRVTTSAARTSAPSMSALEATWVV